MRKGSLNFAVGLVTGAVLFGGGTALAASGILAEPSSQTFYVDSKQVQFEAYAIAGHNYVQLRDVGRAMDFGVSYDAARNAAVIDSAAPYVEETPAATPATPSAGGTAREDFSQQANTTIFTGGLTREVYNAIRQTIVDRDTLLAGDGQGCAYVTGNEETERAMDEVTATLGDYPSYFVGYQPGNRLSCNIKYPSAYADADTHTQAFIRGISSLTQAEQVKEITWYVCDRLTYEATSLSSPRVVLSSDGVTPGNCMSYAHSFQFLCARAGIPCILLHSEDHQWNKVYVDGAWWDVDVSSNDAGDDTSFREYSKVLCDQSDMQGESYINAQPEITAFAMELLAPGSTK